MTTLKLDKIYKKYPNATHYSVEDFSIDIKDKEFIVLLVSKKSQKVNSISMVKWLMTNHQKIVTLPWYSKTMHFTLT